MEDTAAPTTTIGDAAAALALADSSPATPATETPAETPAPAATTQAAAEPPAPESVTTETPQTGEPPKWRWQDILANARETSQKEGYERARQEVESQYADFKSLSPEERAGLAIWNRALQGDPAAVNQVAQVNPALAAAITGRAPETVPEPEPQPDAAIQLADGSQVPVFTPEGMKKWQQWNQKQLASQLESQFTEKFKPALTVAERMRQQEEQEARYAQHKAWASDLLAPYVALPDFNEYFKPKLAEFIKAPDFRMDQADVLIRAKYAELFKERLAQLTKEGESSAVAKLQQRAVAGSPNPASASTATPPSTLGNARAALEAANAALSGAA